MRETEQTIQIDGLFLRSNLITMNLFKKNLLILICLLLFTGANVQASSSYTSPEFTTLIGQSSFLKIAVLPVNNFSVDPEIAYFFRSRLVEDLKAKGFSVLSLNAIDHVLYDLGLTHADQLALLSIDELAERLDADLFLSGAIEQAATQHGGIYNAYVYSCSLKLQHRNGNDFWHVLQERVAKRRFAVDPVNALLDIVLVEKGGDKKSAVSALADTMLEKFPEGPSKVLIGDPLLNAAVEISAGAE